MDRVHQWVMHESQGGYLIGTVHHCVVHVSKVGT